ncbi:hypothetical protein [Streptomyces virginiae]
MSPQQTELFAAGAEYAWNLRDGTEGGSTAVIGGAASSLPDAPRP